MMVGQKWRRRRCVCVIDGWGFVCGEDWYKFDAVLVCDVTKTES